MPSRSLRCKRVYKESLDYVKCSEEDNYRAQQDVRNDRRLIGKKERDVSYI